MRASRSATKRHDSTGRFMNASSALVQIGNLSRRQQATEAEAREARARTWARIRPSTAQIYVENRCNLKCNHCYESEDSHPPDSYALSVADYARIFDELSELGVLYLTFTGGEVFLRRDFLDIVELARKKRFAVTIFTSGTLIDERKAERLAALQVKTVEISVYSHLPEVHDGFTNIPGSHARSLRAMRLLSERGVKTVMKANLMTFNVESIDELIDMATSAGADYSFDPTVKPRMDGDTAPLRFAVPPEQLRRLVLNRPDLYTAFKKFAPGDLCSGDKSLLEEDSLLCGAARGFISLSADGGVYACGFFPSPGGHLRDRSLKDIWFGSEQFARIRETTYEKMTACASCQVRSTCSPCMAYAEVEHQDHTQCATSSRQLAEAVRLLAQRKVQTNAKLARGRALPLVGDLQVPRPPGKDGAQALTTE